MKQAFSINGLDIHVNFLLREKARMPHAVHGDEWPILFRGRESPSIFGFFWLSFRKAQ
jgi:hypothetical protein